MEDGQRAADLRRARSRRRAGGTRGRAFGEPAERRLARNLRRNPGLAALAAAAARAHSRDAQFSEGTRRHDRGHRERQCRRKRHCLRAKPQSLQSRDRPRSVPAPVAVAALERPEIGDAGARHRPRGDRPIRRRRRAERERREPGSRSAGCRFERTAQAQAPALLVGGARVHCADDCGRAAGAALRPRQYRRRLSACGGAGRRALRPWTGGAGGDRQRGLLRLFFSCRRASRSPYRTSNTS